MTGAIEAPAAADAALRACCAAVLELTEAMCAAARADDWARVSDLNRQRDLALGAVPRPAGDADAPPRASVRALARAAHLDAEVAALARAHRSRIGARMGRQRAARRAVVAYAAFGAS